VGDAGANDEVDPRLQVGGDGEVVHGGSNEDLVCGEEFGDQFVGDGQGSSHFGCVLVSGQENAGDPRDADEGQGIFCQVAQDDLSVGVRGLPSGDEVVAERTRDGVGTSGTGLDVEQGRHMIPLEGGCRRQTG